MIINKLPFFYKSHPDSDNGGLPHVLPFELFYNQDYSMFMQEATQKLNKVLKKVYENGSLVDGSISSESGDVYVPQLLSYLQDNFHFNEQSKVLEIGCGSGIILGNLNKLNVHTATGIEPGNHALVSEVKDNKIVNDFFPSNKIAGKFDIIYSFCVLEHIEHPLKFIRDVIKQLADNGKLIIGVPNCEPYLQQGDVSMFLHEHFSYFTRYNLMKLLTKSQLTVENMKIIEGMILVTASLSAEAEVVEYEKIEETDFYEKCGAQIENLGKILKKYGEKEIAFYVPGRALNALYLLNMEKVRLVDDNSDMHGKYLPYLSNSIESFKDILNDPPKCLIIYSETFGDKIKKKCKAQKELNKTEILTIDEIYR